MPPHNLTGNAPVVWILAVAVLKPASLNTYIALPTKGLNPAILWEILNG